METYVRIECNDCGRAIRVLELALPGGLRSDESFEWHCPSCEAVTYMKLGKEVSAQN